MPGPISQRVAGTWFSWFIWFVWFVWFRERNKLDEPDRPNKPSSLPLNHPPLTQGSRIVRLHSAPVHNARQLIAGPADCVI